MDIARPREKVNSVKQISGDVAGDSLNRNLSHNGVQDDEEDKAQQLQKRVKLI